MTTHLTVGMPHTLISRTRNRRARSDRFRPFLCAAAILVSFLTNRSLVLGEPSAERSTAQQTAGTSTVLNRLVNPYLELSIAPTLGDHPQHLVARRLHQPRPFGGALCAGPVFVQHTLLNGQPLPVLPAKVASRSETHIELRTSHGDLDIVRRYGIEPEAAGYRDEITYHNRGSKPLVLRVGQTAEVSGSREDGPKPTRWAWPSMRWFLPERALFATQAVHFMMPELATNQRPVTRTIHVADGSPLRFGFVNGQALGLLTDVRVGGPVELEVLFDRFPSPEPGRPRCKEVWTRASWQTARDTTLKPGDRLVVKQHVMLLNGQGSVDSWDGDDMAAALDAPAYRDPGEPVDAAARLASDRPQSVRLRWLVQAGPSSDWQEHATQNITLPAGSTVDVPLTTLPAAEPSTRLAIVVESASGKHLRIDKTVLAGQSDAEAARLSSEYHRRFPTAVDFEGTLEQFGRGLIDASRKMRIADGFSPDVQLRWSQTEPGVADRLRANRMSTDDRRQAAAVVAAYRRWFPNYIKVLAGKAAAIGVTSESVALDEQARFDHVMLDDSGRSQPFPSPRFRLLRHGLPILPGCFPHLEQGAMGRQPGVYRWLTNATGFATGRASTASPTTVSTSRALPWSVRRSIRIPRWWPKHSATSARGGPNAKPSLRPILYSSCSLNVTRSTTPSG